MLRFLEQAPQLRGEFEAGDPSTGYYSDLRAKTGGSVHVALETLRDLTSDRARANPIYIAQLGLGAWQSRSETSDWDEVVSKAARWLVANMDDEGRVAYLFPTSHTYRLEPPWYSAMAQGEVASLLVRAASASEASLVEDAARAVHSILEPSLGLMATTAAGPVLQEYPTDPPAHVLNGWITALWGIYDIACTQAAGGAAKAARVAFETGVDALEARLPFYHVAGRWSRYDLYPHPLANVASPFYHRLHIEQLAALHTLAPRDVFERVAQEWTAGLENPWVRMEALTRKVAFRVVRPRNRYLRLFGA